MDLSTATASLRSPVWTDAGTSRIPFAAYTSDELHRASSSASSTRPLVLRRPRGRDPEPGRLQAQRGRRALGDHGARAGRRIHVVENVCAHRGMGFCRERSGNRKDFTCPYHQWNYSLKGDLQGVPFAAASSRTARCRAACRPTSSSADNGLTKLKVATPRRRGLRVVRPRRRAVRGLPRADDPALLRPPVRRPRSSSCSATTASASRATGS